jgi:hypothetical protein
VLQIIGLVPGSKGSPQPIPVISTRVPHRVTIDPSGLAQWYDTHEFCTKLLAHNRSGCFCVLRVRRAS